MISQQNIIRIRIAKGNPLLINIEIIKMLHKPVCYSQQKPIACGRHRKLGLLPMNHYEKYTYAIFHRSRDLRSYFEKIQETLL